MALSKGEALISWVSRALSELLQCCATRAAGRRVAAPDTHDRLPVDWGEYATGGEVDDSPDSDGSATPHWACAFCMTLVLSSRNINDSWSRYPGHVLRTRTHCVHCGWALSHYMRVRWVSSRDPQHGEWVGISFDICTQGTGLAQSPPSRVGRYPTGTSHPWATWKRSNM